MSFGHFKRPRILFHSTGDLGESAILGHLNFGKYLGKLISYLDPVVPDAIHSEFVRCWHAKTDGSAASTFHNKCDGKGPTVTIIKSGSYIFGGYTDLSWKSKYLWELFSLKPCQCYLYSSTARTCRCHSRNDMISLNTNIILKLFQALRLNHEKHLWNPLNLHVVAL